MKRKGLVKLMKDINAWVVILLMIAAALTAFDVLKVLETKTLQVVVFCVFALSWTNMMVLRKMDEETEDEEPELTEVP